MDDRVLEAFLNRQHDEGMALADGSDLLDLIPLGGPCSQLYVAMFCCKGLVRSSSGEIEEAGRFELGIWFPSDYLRRAAPQEVVSWFGPPEVFHPNIRAPYICIGRLAPGTGLVDILYQCFEIITFNKVTMREDDALNPIACEWARQHQDRFPIDSRPLKRRRLQIKLDDSAEAI